MSHVVIYVKIPFFVEMEVNVESRARLLAVQQPPSSQLMFFLLQSPRGSINLISLLMEGQSLHLHSRFADC